MFLRSAASVGAGDDLQPMPIGVVEVHAAAVVPDIDGAGVAAHRVGPVGLLQSLDTGEDLVELRFRDQEGVVLPVEFAAAVDEVQGRFGTDLDNREFSQQRVAVSCHAFRARGRLVRLSIAEGMPDPARREP